MDDVSAVEESSPSVSTMEMVKLDKLLKLQIWNILYEQTRKYMKYTIYPMIMMYLCMFRFLY